MFFDWKAAAVNVKGTKKIETERRLNNLYKDMKKKKENETRIKGWNARDFKGAK